MPKQVAIGGSIIVWRLGGFGHILDAEYGFCKKLSAVCSFLVAWKWNLNEQLAVFSLASWRKIVCSLPGTLLFT